MAIKMSEKNGGKVLEVEVSGKLVHEDYQYFVPRFEQLAKQHGKLRVLFNLTGFHGWDASALWDEIKLDVKDFSDVERLALVGDKEWEKGMSAFCHPFTTAKIRYFDQTKVNEAYEWLEDDILRA